MVTKEEIKFIELDEGNYMFETMEQLIEMLKEDGYIVDLKIRKIGRLKTTTVIL